MLHITVPVPTLYAKCLCIALHCIALHALTCRRIDAERLYNVRTRWNLRQVNEWHLGFVMAAMCIKPVAVSVQTYVKYIRHQVLYTTTLHIQLTQNIPIPSASTA